jgi:transposase
MDPAGQSTEQRWIEHCGSSLAELVAWLRGLAPHPGQIAVAIELPSGAVVETLVDQGFAVFSINPKQLDRFRDRYSPAGAKDDRRDALVLADSLRTDPHCFRAVQIDDPAVIRLRELSRLDQDLQQEQGRLQNQLRQQWHRYFPQLLKLSPAADEAWVWDLFQAAPLPGQAAKLASSRIQRLLQKNRIRRIDAAQVHTILSAQPLTVAPGAAEAASEHALMLLPRLRLLVQQRTQLAQKTDAILKQLAALDPDADQGVEHRDAAILLSLPGIGSHIAATMLSEAPQAIAQRDYHAFRCLCGVAPVTRQSGKSSSQMMRQACNQRLRNALYHCARVNVMHDLHSKAHYARLRAKGHSHGRALRGVADRLLALLVAMLKSHALYDPTRRCA